MNSFVFCDCSSEEFTRKSSVNTMSSTRSHTASQRIGSNVLVVSNQPRRSIKSVQSEPGTSRTNLGRAGRITSSRAPDGPEFGKKRTKQTVKNAPGHYPITGLVREGLVYNQNGTIWAERGLLVEHEKLVYRLKDVDTPDLEPQSYRPINAPGSGEKYMFGHSAAEILDSEMVEIEARRRAKSVVNPDAQCRFCERWFTRHQQRDDHEKNRCRHPGAPHHQCDEICHSSDKECPGAKPWQKAPDRRFTR